MSLYSARAALKFKMTEHLLGSSTCLLLQRGTKQGHLIRVAGVGGDRQCVCVCACGAGEGVKPNQPATPMQGLVIVGTLDHIYLQFTPSRLDL